MTIRVVSVPLEQLAELAALWGGEVRVSVHRGTWRVAVVSNGGTIAATAPNIGKAIADALFELQALDAQETA